MRKNFIKKLSVATVIAATLLTGCGKGSDVNDNNSKDAGNASSVSSDSESTTDGGRSINVGLSADVATLDNNIADVPGDLLVINTMQDSLYGRMADGTVDLQLAESVDISDDKLTYTFHLRDAKYSNGETIEAEDFVYSWKRLVNPDTGSEYAWLAGAAGIANADEIAYAGGDIDTLGVEAVDAKTLVVTLSVETPYFKYIVATPTFAPIDEDFGEAQGDQYGLSKDNIISSGPFVVDEWVVGGSEIKLKKNENYWDADNIQPNALVFQTVADSQAGVLAYDSGTLDVVELSGEQLSQYVDDPALDVQKWPASNYLYINHTNEYLANKDFRLAINYAVNKDEIVDNILKNGSIAVDYFIPDDFSPDDNGTPYHQTVSLDYIGYDLDKAAEYWEKAKEELGADSFTLEYLYDDREVQKNIAQYLKSTLESALPGLELELREVPYSACWDEQKAGNFDLTVSMWGADYIDPSVFFDILLSDSEYNLGRWNSSEYDAIIADANNNKSDYTKRFQIYNDAEQLIIDEVGLIPVYQVSQSSLIRPGIHVPFNSIYLYRFATFD
ncbi:MAG: peptide ABC transporter substrate-binding protein [Lachnospiraceae bacterium]|nr:peptide ABC transporter substrate-binding protein [Lachnospiraceae bacterium]